MPDTSQVVRVRWISSLIPSETNWHPCLLVEVSPNDGSKQLGNHVRENNNLGQKNITIIDARRSELVMFPFKVGNKRSIMQEAELMLKVGHAPQNISIYLNIDDSIIIDSLKSRVMASHVVPNIMPIKMSPSGVTVTLLNSVTVAFPFTISGPEIDNNSLAFRLPANTEIKIHSEQLEHIFRLPKTPIFDGFDLVTIDNKLLLRLSAKQGRLRFPLKPGETKQMSLNLAISDNMVTGDKYEIQIIENDTRERALGGVIVQIEIIE